MYTFDNPVKAGFSKKKYPVIIKTFTTHLVKSIFLIETRVFFGLIKIFDSQNQLPFRFGVALA